MSKEEYTFEQKLDWLENHLGVRLYETELHPKRGVGSFEWEVNHDFNKLYTLDKEVYNKLNQNKDE